MIIDFHTHVFPDALAPKALASLLAGINYIYKPCTDMTLAGLAADMDNSGVNISVIQPVITKPSQFAKLNEFSAAICSPRIAAFGAVHPNTADFKADIDYIVSLGLKGIKFHADYQNVILDEPRMLKIYDYAISRGLIILHHAGFDPAMPPPYKSNPERFAHIIKELRGGTIIAAHMGGHAQWDDVERFLVGTDIYLDTSMSFKFMPEAQYKRIIEAHGADKILFASDSPWGDPASDIALIESLPITEGEKTAILGGNAARLLGIRQA